MTNCIPNGIFESSSKIPKFNPKFHLEYYEFWEDVLKDSRADMKPLQLTEIENILINVFPIIINKKFHKRSSEGLISADMPVVFMPQKSATDCVSKPKVNYTSLIL